MTYSGCQQEIFTTRALDEVHKASAGISRMINRVCEKVVEASLKSTGDKDELIKQR